MPIFSKMMPSDLICITGFFLIISIIIMQIQQFIVVAAGQTIDFCGEPFTVWDPSHLKVLQNGTQLQLVLDQKSGSGLGSVNEYLFGHFEIQMKVAPGDTAGTVTSFYAWRLVDTACRVPLQLSSAETTGQDARYELDFEFLGNVSGEPYLLQTNIFTNGTGYKEQRISLWFDPTADFHIYSMHWTKEQVIFAVDGMAIRTFANNEAWGQLYVDRYPMGAFVSIWNGDDWATLGGLVKINWTASPFTASYQNFKANACIFQGNISECEQSKFATANPFATQLLDSSSLRSIQDDHKVYDYCHDRERFEDIPLECTIVP